MHCPCRSHRATSRLPRRGRLSTRSGTIADGAEVQEARGCGLRGASAGAAGGETGELGAHEEEEVDLGVEVEGAVLLRGGAGVCSFWREKAVPTPEDDQPDQGGRRG